MTTCKPFHTPRATFSAMHLLTISTADICKMALRALANIAGSTSQMPMLAVYSFRVS